MNTLEDNKIFNIIYSQFESSIKREMFSSLTNKAIPLPKSLEQKKQLLNYFLYQPEFVMVWSDTMTYAHLDVWKNLINSSKYKFAITAPSMKGRNYDKIGLLNTPFYAWDEGFKPHNFLNVNSNLVSFFYFVNKAKNIKFITKYRDKLHVHFHHGDSDKAGSANRSEQIFDYLVVTDKNSIQRYHEKGILFDYDKFLPLGGIVLPGVKFFDKPSTNIKRILYAPTFEGWSEDQNFSSVKRSYEALKAYNPEWLLVRGHHSIGTRNPDFKDILKELSSRNTQKIKDKESQFNWSDAIISDISGVTSEYLFTGKPIIIPIDSEVSWIYDYFSKTVMKNFCYVWDYKKYSLLEFLKSISDDPLYEERIKRRNQLYLGINNFSESLTLFENTLQYLKTKYTYKKILNDDTFILPKETNIKLSNSIELKNIVEEISQGNLVFI